MQSAETNAPLEIYVDVSEVVASPWRAGIQRVVLQLLGRLLDDDRVCVTPVVWLDAAGSFRHVTGAERTRLTMHDAPPPTGGATAGRRSAVVAAVKRRLSPTLNRLGVAVWLRRLRRVVRSRWQDRPLVPLSVTLPPGSVLLELDSVWNNVDVDRGALYSGLRQRGVHVAALVYDLFPQDHPEWFEPSMVAVSNRTLAAQAEHAEAVFAISRHTADRLVEWSGRRGIVVTRPQVVTLGADWPEVSAAALPPELTGHPYVLVVGTLEPRKNHAVLLDAFEVLSRRHEDVRLVVVGRPGWRNEDTLRRLDGHPLLGDRIHWYRSSTDEELDALYRSATVVAVPSMEEGFGLPVLESLVRGTPVIASGGGALSEFPEAHVERADPIRAEEWVRSISRHVDGSGHNELRRAELEGFDAPEWSDAHRCIVDELRDRFGVDRGLRPGAPFVRAVVVNWNSHWLTRRCLGALSATEYEPDRLEVVVVDNGSVDGSLERLRDEFSDVRFVETGANLGFAAACNLAMTNLGGVDHVALINNDTVVEPGWLRSMIEASSMSQSEKVGAVAARLVLEPAFAPIELSTDHAPVEVLRIEVDGRDVTAAAVASDLERRGFPEWPLRTYLELEGRGSVLVPASDGAASATLEFRGAGGTLSLVTSASDRTVPIGPERRVVEIALGDERVEILNGLGTERDGDAEFSDRLAGRRNVGKRTPELEQPPRVVDGFCGGGVLLDSDMLDEVGCFEGGYFAYYEDADLAWRAARRGWDTVTAPGAVVRHRLGGSGLGGSPTFFYLNYRNWLLTALRNGDATTRSAAMASARDRLWRAVRGNVLSRLRHGRRPSLNLVLAWSEVVLSVARFEAARRLERYVPSVAAGVGRIPRRLRVDVPAIAPKPGGPRVVALDIGGALDDADGPAARTAAATLRSPPELRGDPVDVVPVVAVPGGYRRASAAEVAVLLGSAPGSRAAGPVAEPSPPVVDRWLGITPEGELLERSTISADSGSRIALGAVP